MVMDLGVRVGTLGVRRMMIDYVLNVGDDWQTAIDASSAGQSFLIRSGTHRHQTVTPKARQRFVAELGAVASGARILTGWVADGSDWKVAGQTQEAATNEDIVARASAPRANHPEDLFMDDVALTHVASRGALTAGAWFFDYTADIIYMRDNPAGHVMETSTTSRAFQGTADAVQITGLTIEKYANNANEGAIHAESTTNWFIDNCEICRTHGTGLRIGPGMKVRNGLFHHNGLEGMGGGFGTGIVIDGARISYNNRWFNSTWGGGGTKFVQTNGLVVRNVYSHHNSGPGLWTDGDNINTIYEDNVIEDNVVPIGELGHGLIHEISYSAIIRRNTFRRNGGDSGLYGYGAALVIAASGGGTGIDIWGNILEDNQNGIALLQQSRGSGAYGLYRVQNVSVHDNRTTQNGGYMGAYTQDGTDGATLSSWSNSFQNNRYTLTGAGDYFLWPNTPLSDAAWRGVGHDTTGIFTRV